MNETARLLWGGKKVVLMADSLILELVLEQLVDSLLVAIWKVLSGAC